jgi:hypothetical protein
VSVPVASVGVASELAVVGPPRVGGLDDPSQPESQRLCLAGFLGAAPLHVEIVDAERGETLADDRVVVAAIEVQRVDVAEQPSISDASSVGTCMRTSLRFAPSIAQPTGTPWRSDATDHFQPDFTQSVGFGPVPSPP